jgi:hypothetical protein
MATSLKHLFVAAGMLAAFAVPTFAAKAKVGAEAPGFTLTDNDGVTHQLSDYAGKTVVLEWINPECPFVKKHYRSGNLPGLQTAATGEGVVWLLINSGHQGAQGVYSPAKAQAWLDKMGSAATAYLRDQSGEVGKLSGAKTTPHMYVINPGGTLVYQGAIDSIPSANPKDIDRAQNYVRDALDAVAAGEAVGRASTQAYGCSVKY